MLCEACQKAISSIRTSQPGFHSGTQPRLFQYILQDDTWRGAHHIEDGTFSSAVRDQCYVCYTLREACPRRARKYANLFRTFYEIEPQGNGRYLLRIAIETSQLASGAGAGQVIAPYGTFKIFPKINIPEVCVRLGLTENTFLKECETQIRIWLDDCEEHHAICIDDWRTKPQYPVRLLDVSPAQGEQISLFELNEGQRCPQCVTMSHCWNHGDGIHLTKLTKETYQRLKNGINMNTLPKKFQNAIELARWMKKDYLWIDAVCIIQDSVVDWQQQSSIMVNIYTGSFCNIAATSADETIGCFRRRPTEFVEPYLISNPESSSSEKTHIIGYVDFWCNSLLDTDLHTRAWVLQERLLSPRTIHFGMEQMFWECRQHKACEAYPKGVPDEFINHRTRAWRLKVPTFYPRSQMTEPQSVFAQLANWFCPSDDICSDPAHRFWRTAVELHMDCNLSLDSDKLVAISGIASKVKEMTGEWYLAGLWDNPSIAQSLLGYVPVKEQANGRASVRSPSRGRVGYRASSWSWASLDARIAWDWKATHNQVLLAIEDTKCEAPGDGMSSIESAEMHVIGCLIAMELSIVHTNKDGSPEEDGSYALFPRRTHSATTRSKISSKLHSHVEPIVYLDTPLLHETNADVYLLPVCTGCRDRNDNVIATVAGLILRKVASSEKTLYERVGIFRLNHSQAHMVEGFSGDLSVRASNFEQIILI